MSIDISPLSSTPRTTLRRHRERGVTDRAELYAVLDAGLICHLGVVASGDPVVLPTAYGRAGDTLYLHGSSANGAFWAADGQRICVTVTQTGCPSAAPNAPFADDPCTYSVSPSRP